MGSDMRVANAARVSYGKWKTEYDEKDARLIRYLAKHNHFTPFTHCQITLRETVPLFVARQRFKHVVGFTYNEISRRYVDSDPEFYSPSSWRGRPESSKQGSSGTVQLNHNLQDAVGFHRSSQLDLYRELIRVGVSPEQARMVLPQSMLTSYVVTGSLAAYARAYRLRIARDSQLEIQKLALHWHIIMNRLFPDSWSALIDYEVSEET